MTKLATIHRLAVSDQKSMQQNELIETVKSLQDERNMLVGALQQWLPTIDKATKDKLDMMAAAIEPMTLSMLTVTDATRDQIELLQKETVKLRMVHSSMTELSKALEPAVFEKRHKQVLARVTGASTRLKKSIFLFVTMALLMQTALMIAFLLWVK
jgi:hypothetical protein